MQKHGSQQLSGPHAATCACMQASSHNNRLVHCTHRVACSFHLHHAPLVSQPACVRDSGSELSLWFERGSPAEAAWQASACDATLHVKVGPTSIQLSRYSGHCCTPPHLSKTEKRALRKSCSRGPHRGAKIKVSKSISELHHGELVLAQAPQPWCAVVLVRPATLGTHQHLGWRHLL